MLVFSEIPAHYLPEMQRIERVSNPVAWTAENIQDGFQQFMHLGAFVGNELVAFVLYRMTVDEAEIIHLVCDREHQGKGYAYQLLKQLQQQLTEKKVTTLFLEVRDGNTPAQKLYDEFGFESVGRRANYYGGKHDAIIQRIDF